MTQRTWAIVFLLSSVLVTPLWATVQMLGILPFLLLALVLFLVRSFHSFESIGTATDRQLGRPSPGSVLTGLLICAPALTYLAMIWRDEFPFVGDYDYHLMQAEVSFAFWKTAFVPVVALIVIICVIARRNAGSWLLPLVLLVMLALGYTRIEPLGFGARYPGSFYFVLTPLKALAWVSDWDQPLNALRLTNALSIPIYLFVMRPLILRRWPDVSALMFGTFFYWQKDVVYYLTSAYLEPWSLMLIAIAAELLFVSSDQWKAYLAIGAAALFKEQAILILPFAALAAWPVRGDRQAKTAHALMLLVAVTPFALYYLLRKSANVWRTAGLAAPEQIFNTERVAIFAHRVWLQFDLSIVLLIAASAVLLAFSLKSAWTRVYGSLLAAAVFQVVFFYTDRISVAWTGYPRFHLFPLLLVGSVSFGPEVRAWAASRRIHAGAVLATVMIVNVVTATPLFGLTKEPEYRRNFVEHYDSPIYFPIDAGLRAAGSELERRKISTIRVFTNIDSAAPNYDVRVMGLAYPRLRERYSFIVPRAADQEPSLCACRDPLTAPLALFINFTNLSEDHPQKQAAEFRRQQCLTIMADSCASVIRVPSDNPAVVAVGLSRRR